MGELYNKLLGRIENVNLNIKKRQMNYNSISLKIET